MRLLSTSLALPVALVTGCMANAIDPIELVRSDVRADLDQPELSVLPDGTLQQRYLVLLRDDVVQAGLLDDTVVDLALSEDVLLERVYRTALAGFAAPLSNLQAAAMRARPEVLLVEEDRRFEASRGGPPQPPPPPPAVDWALTDVLGTGYTGDTGNSTDGAGATVAVLDTGIDSDHPYLPATTCLGNFTGGTGCEDGQGHGTHVAGTIAALPSSGHRGIAPGVALSIAKVLNDSGSGATSGIAAAINAAAEAGIDVLNMSLGGSMIGGETSDALCIAINGANALGTASVVAAGNESTDSGRTSPGGCDGAITVAAYDSAGKLASFTNTGADVDIAAPGVAIYSTTNNGLFGSKNGTSMASPHAAAVAALVVAANPAATPADIKAALIANSADRGAPTNYSRKISLSGVWKLDGRDY